MTKINEIDVYDKSKVSIDTGEIEEWDDAIFPNVIRKKLVALIKVRLQSANPKVILDYGCGGGWLSALLSEWGFNVVGVDISALLSKNAKFVCPKIDFVVCDGERLPFRNAVFDYVVGISVLHHLNLKRSCSELKRILINKADFIFEEPNLLNPFSAIGRELFPMKPHTKGEKPFIPRHLKTALRESGFCFREIRYLFFMAFPFSRLFKIANMKPKIWMVKLVFLLENMTEKTPLIRHLNSSMVIVGKIRK